MLAGFKSRWMMPASCAASMASASWRAIATDSVTDMRARLEPCGERDAIDVLEDQRADAVLLRQAVDGSDAGMIDGRENLRFAPEPRQPIRIVRELRQQYLERHVAVDAAIACAVDLAHAAAPQQLDDLVVLDGVARREDVGGRRLQLERPAYLGAEVASQRAARLEKAVVAPRLADDRGERVAERAIVGGCAPHERLALFWRQRQRAVEQIVGFRPPAEVQMFFQNYASPPP